MVYRVEGLGREAHEPPLNLSDVELGNRGALRVKAESKPGFPFRVSLGNANAGEAAVPIRVLFERIEVEAIHAHNAAAGCFAARIVRD
jgi:hypothetical protein